MHSLLIVDTCGICDELAAFLAQFELSHGMSAIYDLEIRAVRTGSAHALRT